MSEFLSIFHDFTPGSYGVYGIFLLLTVHFTKLWYEDKKYLKTLSAEDRLAKREGFQRLAERLMAENRDLREEYDRHREQCYAETAQLRQDLIKKEFEIAGLMRKMDDLGREVARLKGYTGDAA